MYSGYGIGEPAQPAVAGRGARVDRHEGADRDDARVRVAIATVEATAEAGCCWPMTAMVSELSAATPSWVPRADTTAMAATSAAARRLSVGLGNLTNWDLAWTLRTSAAHLDRRLWRKQTTAVIQGGRARGSDIRH